MSNTTRRRSRNLRLVLASLALLGIGAAITAAAWTDVVYVDVEVASGSMDLEGQVTQDGVGSGWLQSDNSNSVELAVDLTDLTPGDSHDVTVELRNNGGMTAYVTVDASQITPGSVPGTCPLALTGDLPTDTTIPGNGDVSWTFNLSAPANWGTECQNVTFVSGVVAFQATTDAP